MTKRRAMALEDRRVAAHVFGVAFRVGDGDLADDVAFGHVWSSLSLRRLWHDHVRSHLPALLVALVFMTIEGAALGAFAWLVRPLFEGLFDDSSMDGVIWVGALIAGLFVLRAFSGFTQRIIVVTVGLKVTTRLQGRLVTHLMGLDQRFFQDNPPGALIERVRGDTTALQSLATTALMAFGRDSITLLSLLAVMFLTDWVWTVSALVGIPLLIVPLIVLYRFIRSTALESRVAAARISTRLDEIFHGIQTIKLNRLERSEDARFERELKSFLRPSIRAQAGLAANPATMDLIAAAGFIAVLWFGGQQIVTGDKTIGEFMSFFTALGLMFEPLAAPVEHRGAGAGEPRLGGTDLRRPRQRADDPAAGDAETDGAGRHPVSRRSNSAMTGRRC
jgi:subfamily B ATP-binding cassette protein MsbA